MKKCHCLTCVNCFLDFDPDFIRSKSGAAAGLCSWVINVCKFYEVFCEVEPKRRALNDANQMLQDAQTRLSNLVSKVAQLEETLADLTRRYTVRRGVMGNDLTNINLGCCRGKSKMSTRGRRDWSHNQPCQQIGGRACQWKGATRSPLPNFPNL